MAQRIEDGGLIVSCNFCGTDWDGQWAAIEGHRGSIVCLECIKIAIDNQTLGAEPYTCPLCLRDKIPASIPRWSHPNHPEAFACHNCIEQAADTFTKDADIPWKREGGASPTPQGRYDKK